MKKLIIAISIIVLGATASNAQDGQCVKNVALEGQEFVKTRGKNPHIKKDFEKGKLIIIPYKTLQSLDKSGKGTGLNNLKENNNQPDVRKDVTVSTQNIDAAEIEIRNVNLFYVTEI